jgi:hypothetical protein
MTVSRHTVVKDRGGIITNTYLSRSRPGPRAVSSLVVLLMPGLILLPSAGTGVLAAPGGTCYFAEGCPGDGFEEWLCLQNAYDTPAAVTVTYHPEGGPGLSISAVVNADKPIIRERPMYFDFRGEWSGGHCVVGFVP